MSRLFIIGLPKAISNRLKAAAKVNDMEIECILADTNLAGALELIPFDGDAIYSLSAYIDTLEEYSDANLLVLPYALISGKIQNELDVLSEYGASITEIKAKKDGWPWLDGRPDQGFLDSLFTCFELSYFPRRTQTPSEYFRALSVSNNRMLITTDSLTHCDKVAPHRRKFFIESADAFIEYLVANGSVGKIEDFFKHRAIEHAQSGGINASLRIESGQKTIYNETKNTHLKRGDKTTPQGAARIYYHALFLEKLSYVGILYVGPHPSVDVSRIYQLA